MPDLPGTNVAGPLVPFSNADVYPTHDSKYGKGGWREVGTIAERSAIPPERLTPGCVVVVTSDPNPANNGKWEYTPANVFTRMATGGTTAPEVVPAVRTVAGNTTLTSDDVKAGALLKNDPSTETTVTVPAPSGLPQKEVSVAQRGAAAFSLVAGAGAVLSKRANGLLKSSGVNTVLHLLPVSATEWLVSGDLAATGGGVVDPPASVKLDTPILTPTTRTWVEGTPPATLFTVSNRGSYPAGVDLVLGASDTRWAWNSGKTALVPGVTAMTPGSATITVRAVPGTATGYTQSDTASFTATVTAAEAEPPDEEPVSPEAYVAEQWQPQVMADTAPSGAKILPQLPRTTSAGYVQGLGFKADTTIPSRNLSFGMVFPKGKVLPTQGIVFEPVVGTTVIFQMDVRTRWSDGSVKLCSLSGPAPGLTAGVLKPGSLKVTTAPTGPDVDVTLVDLSQFAASVTLRSVQVYNDGTITPLNQTFDVSPAALRTGTPTYWRRGPICTDARYEKVLVPGVRVVMNLRAYSAQAGGGFAIDMQMRTDLNLWSNPNGWTSWYHDFSITQGGTSVLSVVNKRMFLGTMYHKVLYSDLTATQNALKWQPIPVPIVDAPIWSVQGAVPPYNYAMGVSDATLAAYATEATATDFRTPLYSNGLAMAMNGTGARRDLGVLPGPCADFLGTGDLGAYKLGLGMAEGSGSVPWNYHDPVTNRSLNNFDHPGMWIDARGNNDGVNPADLTVVDAGSAGWTLDMAHQPNSAYFGYLTTGDEFFHDLFSNYAAYNVADAWYVYRQRDTDKDWLITQGGQVRETGWRLVPVAYAAEFLPESHPTRVKFRELLVYNFNYLISKQAAWQANQGAAFGAHAGCNQDPITDFKPWMDDHAIAGMVTAYMAAGIVEAQQHLLWKINWALGRFRKAASGFDHRRGSYYMGNVGDITTPNWIEAARTWAGLNAIMQPPTEGVDSHGYANGNYTVLALRSVGLLGIALKQDVSDIFNLVLGNQAIGTTDAEYRDGGLVDNFRPFLPASGNIVTPPDGGGGTTVTAPTITASQSFTQPANMAAGGEIGTLAMGGGAPDTITTNDARVAVNVTTKKITLVTAFADSTTQKNLTVQMTAQNAGGSVTVPVAITFTAVAAVLTKPTFSAQSFSQPANLAAGGVIGQIVMSGGAATSATSGDTRVDVSLTGQLTLHAALADSTQQVVMSPNITMGNSAGSTSAVQTITMTAVPASAPAPYAAPATSFYNRMAMRRMVAGFTDNTIELKAEADDQVQAFGLDTNGDFNRTAVTNWLATKPSGNRGTVPLKWMIQDKPGRFWTPPAGMNPRFTRPDGSFYFQEGGPQDVPGIYFSGNGQGFEQSVTDFAAGNKWGLTLSFSMTGFSVNYARFLNYIATGQTNDFDNPGSLAFLDHNDGGMLQIEKNLIAYSFMNAVFDAPLTVTYFAQGGVGGAVKVLINDSGLITNTIQMDGGTISPTGKFRIGFYNDAITTDQMEFILTEMGIILDTVEADMEVLHNNAYAYNTVV